jgi:hypothetical protein
MRLGWPPAETGDPDYLAGRLVAADGRTSADRLPTLGLRLGEYGHSSVSVLRNVEERLIPSGPQPLRSAWRAMIADKQQIAVALAKHNVRTACTLVDLAVLVIDLLDVQSSTVIEAIIDEAKRRHVTGPKNRQGVREALIQYAEDRLKEARERERRLYHGITAERLTPRQRQRPRWGWTA